MRRFFDFLFPPRVDEAVLRGVSDDTFLASLAPRLVPVPLSRERQKERGFNQIEEVARRVARELDIAVHAALLERTRDTVSQVSLPRERREENMRGAFIVSPNPAVSGRRRINPSHTYILIDDVITTGATLQAALDALRSGGALHVIPLALAH